MDQLNRKINEIPDSIKPLSAKELLEVLGLTIKYDNENKLITFLAFLSAYTENSQLNVSFNAPSSTGKSYIPMQIAELFPEKDVIEIAYCSSTAFFHEQGRFCKQRNGVVVDLSRKILIFMDQPHTLLLERLRPLLSHDKKEIEARITDKSQKNGLRTKTVFLIGFPVVVFCSAGLKIDEQESTRFILLSPQTSQEKIRESIHEKLRKEADSKAYKNWINENEKRKLLKDRISLIKAEHVEEIKICCPEKIETIFLEKNKMLRPRHSRDVSRITALTKAFALLNLWHRKREGASVEANEEDVANALAVWDSISCSQEFNLPPYVYCLYQEVILACIEDKKKKTGDERVGIARNEVMKKHIEVYGRSIADWQLRQEVIPMLENAGLISQEPDQSDRRKWLIFKTTESLTIEENLINSESGGGVIGTSKELDCQNLRIPELTHDDIYGASSDAA